MNGAMVEKLQKNKTVKTEIRDNMENIIINGYDGKQTTIFKMVIIKNLTLHIRKVEKTLDNVKFLIIETKSKEPEIIISQKLLNNRLGFDILEELERHLIVSENNETVSKDTKEQNHDINCIEENTDREDSSDEELDIDYTTVETKIQGKIINVLAAMKKSENVNHDDDSKYSDNSRQPKRKKQLINLVDKRLENKDTVEIRIEEDACFIVLPNYSIRVDEEGKTQKIENRPVDSNVAPKAPTGDKTEDPKEVTIYEFDEFEGTEEMISPWLVVSDLTDNDPDEEVLTTIKSIARTESFLFRNSTSKTETENHRAENKINSMNNNIDKENIRRSNHIKRRVQKAAIELYGDENEEEFDEDEFTQFGSEIPDEKLKEILDKKIMESKINLDLNTEQTQELKDLVYEYTFEKRILRTRLGSDMIAQVPPFELNLKKDAIPKKLHHYPMSTEAEKQLIRYARELMKNRMIIRGNQNAIFVSPTQMVVQKKPKPMRLVMDMRYINSQSWSIQGVMVPVAEKIDKIRDFYAAVIVDMKNGFWQMPLHENSQNYFAFSTPFGTFVPLRLPQGAADSPIWFHLNMQKIMIDIIEEYNMILWIDDNLIWAENWEELIRFFKLFLERCFEYQIQINLNKTTFPMQNVEFCGYNIDRQGYRLVSKNYEAMQKIPQPITGGDLGAFLFMYNWIRNNYIPEIKLLGTGKGKFSNATLASVSEPLWNVMKNIYEQMGSNKKSKYKNFQLTKAGWNDEHKKLIEFLKGKLADMIRTTWRKPGTKLCLLTDASDLYWSYVITQVIKWNDEKQVWDQTHEILALRSGAFANNMLNWNIQSKEAYAIVAACGEQQHLLYEPGGFTIWCDNKNLVSILDPESVHPLPNKPTKQRLANWLAIIAQFRINDFLNIAGDDNSIPDAFTRNLTEEGGKDTPEEKEIKITEDKLLNNNFTLSGISQMISGHSIKSMKTSTTDKDEEEELLRKIYHSVNTMTRQRKRELEKNTVAQGKDNEGPDAETESNAEDEEENTAETKNKSRKRKREIKIQHTEIINEMIKLQYDYDSEGLYQMPDEVLIKAAQNNLSDAMKLFKKQNRKNFTMETTHRMLCYNKKYWIPHDCIELQVRITLIAHIGQDPKHPRHGHRNIADTTSEIKKYFEWEGLQEFVRHFGLSCLQCIKTKDNRDIVPRTMGDKEPRERLEEISADYLYIGPTEIKTPTGLEKQDYKYILVIKCIRTRFVKLIPCTNANADVMAEALIEWIHLFKAPEILRTDQGTHFINNVLSQIENVYGYKHKFTIPYSAWTNGSVERVMPEIIKLIKLICKDDLGTWPNHCDQIGGILNDTKSKTLGNQTPRQLMLAIDPEEDFKGAIYDSLTEKVTTSKIDIKDRNFKAQLGRLVQTLERNDSKADVEIKKRRLENQRNKITSGAVKLRAQELNKPPEEITSEDLIPRFGIGDYVNVAIPIKAKDHKLLFRWRGPYRIIEAISNYIYHCENIATGTVTEHHAQRLKFFCDKDLDIEVPELKSEIRKELYFHGGKVVESFSEIRKNEAGLWEVLTIWRGFTIEEAQWRTINDIILVSKHEEMLIDWLEKQAMKYPEELEYKIVYNSLTNKKKD